MRTNVQCTTWYNLQIDNVAWYVPGQDPRPGYRRTTGIRGTRYSHKLPGFLFGIAAGDCFAGNFFRGGFWGWALGKKGEPSYGLSLFPVSAEARELRSCARPFMTRKALSCRFKSNTDAAAN